MNKEKVVISGINGFVGKHLARELNSSGLSVVGIGQDAEVNNNISDVVDEYYQADLTEKWPDIPHARAIIHLAGLAVVAPSFNKPQAYIGSNSAMVTNLCEYYIKQDQKPRIILVSSGSVYDPKQQMPIVESGKIGVTSPYVVSKMTNEYQAEYYRNRGLDCIVVRPFNHIGPGQEQGFILPDLYNRLTTLENDNQKIVTGNIETKRDYTDVRDVVKAYGKIALAPILRYSLYNISSGHSLSGADILNELKAILNMPNVEYEIDPSLVRPTDIKDIVGDSSRIQEELGWMPQIDIHQTVLDFVKSKSS